MKKVLAVFLLFLIVFSSFGCNTRQNVNREVYVEADFPWFDSEYFDFNGSEISSNDYRPLLVSPSVVIFQKNITMNSNRNEICVYTDEYTIPVTIDLDKYLSDESSFISVSRGFEYDNGVWLLLSDIRNGNTTYLVCSVDIKNGALIDFSVVPFSDDKQVTWINFVKSKSGDIFIEYTYLDTTEQLRNCILVTNGDGELISDIEINGIIQTWGFGNHDEILCLS